MVFNSLEFFLFFPAVAAVYFLLGHRLRWGFLLGASCLFYMAFVPAYILILAVLIVVDYVAGKRIEESEGKARKIWLIGSIAATCLTLFAFKYFNFVNSNLAGAASLLGLEYPIGNLSILLPVGLSFHTFQSLSYVLEVYFGRQKAERHLGIYSLYVMFFPQLVAGPIERPQALLHQFRAPVSFDPDRIADGLKLMLWGLTKKVVVADRLAILVDSVYNDAAGRSGADHVLATVFFAFQIYCDFSGYSDIARGAARVLGFELMRNFDHPYASTSVSQFWRRWHISLSFWFRDYIFAPLRDSKGLVGRWYSRLMITFLVSGLWHGAAWNFVIWGGLNGLYLVAEKALALHVARWLPKIGLRPGSHTAVAIGVVFTFVLISFSWIFFRAEGLGDALLIAGSVIRWTAGLPGALLGYGPGLQTSFTAFQLASSAAVIAALAVIEWLQRRGIAPRIILSGSPGIRFASCYALMAAIAFLGEFGSGRFIYFQF